MFRYIVHTLGPIVDFVVVDLDRQGQGQVHSHICFQRKREMSRPALFELHGWQQVCCDSR